MRSVHETEPEIMLAENLAILFLRLARIQSHVNAFGQFYFGQRPHGANTVKLPLALEVTCVDRFGERQTGHLEHIPRRMSFGPGIEQEFPGAPAGDLFTPDPAY